MAATSQPPAFDVSLREVDGEAQRKQHRAAQVAFTPLKWSMDWEAALMQLLSNEAGLSFFVDWLQAEAPEDLTQLELLTSTAELHSLENDSALQALLWFRVHRKAQAARKGRVI